MRLVTRTASPSSVRPGQHQGFERPWSVRLDRTIRGSNEVLVTALERSVKGWDVYRVDTVTGGKALLTFDSPGNVSRWVVDFDGVPRAAVRDDVDRDESAWYVRKSEKAPWTEVEKAKFGRLTSQPMQFSPDGRILYVAARRDGSDRTSIHEYEVEGGRWGKAAVVHPERDIDERSALFVADYRARKLLGIRYADDQPSVAWFDAERASVQKSVDAALPDTVNAIEGSTDARRFVVVAYSDRNPGDVYLLDAKTMRLEKLFGYQPQIDVRSTSPAKWVRYPARDGLGIPALLTIPASASGKAVPLVVSIHGGPYVEATTWGYSAEAQFFASRGYAVLQPQFRGTAGFGWKHFSSGFRAWGESMQDDLEDGVRWAVEQGIAIPSRACFYGASYGGYAALMGAIRSAALIRCAVALAAPTSIEYLFDNAQTDVATSVDRTTLMSEHIGDPKTERTRFKRISPLDNADKVGVPVLLAYGGSDARVPIVHGTDFRAALDRHGKVYEWVQYSSEGHGLLRDDDVFDYYARVERFLAKHLQGDRPAAKPQDAPGR
jgi:dipeptidyl aminopeptidase/acylaminoacyl peptidase